MLLKKNKYLICIIAILFLPTLALAVPVATDIIDGALTSTIATMTGKLQIMAFKWLSVFVLLQYTLTNIGMLKSGADIEAIFGKLIGSFFWFGFCFYVVTNGAGFINRVQTSIFTMAGGFAGSAGDFSAGYVFDWGFRMSTTLMDSVNKATGDGWFAKLDFLPSLLTFFSCLLLMIVSAFIGFKIFMLKLEVALVVMMAPLSFSFLGLNALKDQGVAPFKSLISIIYRVILLAAIVSALKDIGTELVDVFSSVNTGSVTDVWNPIFAGLMAFSLLGFLAFKSDSIAANLASGSTNLGSGDVAAAAAMGAAAGAVAASGGRVAVASKPVKAMSDVMRRSGEKSSVSNAGEKGVGGAGGAAPAGKTPSASLSGASGGASAKFDTNSKGVPQKPDSGMGGGSNSFGPGNTGMGDGGAPASDSAAKADASSAQSANVPGSDSTVKTDTPSAKDDVASAGSGADSGLTGAASATDQKFDKLMDQLAKQNGPRKASFKENLGALNNHIAHEKASTSVSINTHHSD